MSGAGLCTAKTIAVNLKARLIPAPAAVPQFPLWAEAALGRRANGDANGALGAQQGRFSCDSGEYCGSSVERGWCLRGSNGPGMWGQTPAGPREPHGQARRDEE